MVERVELIHLQAHARLVIEVNRNIERTQLIALSGPNQRKRADRRTGLEPVMHATEGEEAARAQLHAGVDVGVHRVRNKILGGTAAYKREGLIAASPVAQHERRAGSKRR